ncbi:MAG: GNAT family N-acetyltransferase, partial [Betaproteobacteria bacterium]|nr:GNAT family N-acetyltransferase [Betaproteobacteria bacterium]
MLRPPGPADAAAFVAAARASRRLHGRWASAPDTKRRFDAYVARFSQLSATSSHVGLLVFRRHDHVLVGVVNLSEIVRGAFQSCFAGYYAFAPQAGRGYM